MPGDEFAIAAVTSAVRLLIAISIMLLWGMWDLNKLFERKYERR